MSSCLSCCKWIEYCKSGYCRKKDKIRCSIYLRCSDFIESVEKYMICVAFNFYQNVYSVAKYVKYVGVRVGKTHKQTERGERGEKMQEIGALSTIRSTDKLDLLYSHSNKHFHASFNQFLRLCSKNCTMLSLESQNNHIIIRRQNLSMEIC